MIDENRIIFDPSQAKDDEYFDVDFTLTENEKNYLMNLHSLEDCVFSVHVHEASSIYHLDISVEGNAVLVDAHNGELIDFPLEDSVEVVIDLNDPDSSDIEADEDSLFDLRGSFLALLYNIIPQNYSTVPLTRIETPDYVLMSEEEYEKQKGKSSAFSALDEKDF